MASVPPPPPVPITPKPQPVAAQTSTDSPVATAQAVITAAAPKPFVPAPHVTRRIQSPSVAEQLTVAILNSNSHVKEGERTLPGGVWNLMHGAEPDWRSMGTSEQDKTGHGLWSANYRWGEDDRARRDALLHDWSGRCPLYMGNKNKMTERTVEAIYDQMSPEERAAYTTLNDCFGGGGYWGLTLAMICFPNVKNLVINEYEEGRIEKIRLLHTIDGQMEERLKGMIAARDVEGKIVRRAQEIEASGKRFTNSGTALAQAGYQAMREEIATMPRETQGLLFALLDALQAKMDNGVDYSSATKKYDFRKMFDSAVANVIRDAQNATEMAAAFKARGGTITYVAGDSKNQTSFGAKLDADGVYRRGATGADFAVQHGANVVSVTDPPYYRTTGYGLDGTKSTVKFAKDPTGWGYKDTESLLSNLVDLGDANVYTDEAWWLNKGYEPHLEDTDRGQMAFDLGPQDENATYAQENGTLGTIVGLFDHFDVAGRVASRQEVLGVNHGHTTEANDNGSELGADRGQDEHGAAGSVRRSIRRGSSTLLAAGLGMDATDAREDEALRRGDDRGYRPGRGELALAREVIAQDIAATIAAATDDVSPETAHLVARRTIAAIRPDRLADYCALAKEHTEEWTQAGAPIYDGALPIPLEMRADQTMPDIRYSVDMGKKAREEARRMIEKYRPDISKFYTALQPEHQDAAKKDIASRIDRYVNEIASFDTPKERKAALYWFCKDTIRLPEDAQKVRDAIKTAERAHVDAFRYDRPGEILEKFSQFVPKEPPINPDTVPELSDKREMGHGIVTYLVQDDKQGQAAMRRIINTHFGKDASPWCLLQGDGEGALTSDAWHYWNHYNALPKRVAFKDGKLIAFMATDNQQKWNIKTHDYDAPAEQWWDRADASHDGIPFTERIPAPTGEGTATAYRELMPDGSVTTTKVTRGDPEAKNGTYEEWDNDGVYIKAITKDGDLILEENTSIETGVVKYHWECFYDWNRDGASFRIDREPNGKIRKLTVEWNYINSDGREGWIRYRGPDTDGDIKVEGAGIDYFEADHLIIADDEIERFASSLYAALKANDQTAVNHILADLEARATADQAPYNVRHSIEGIYTGSWADYKKPSLAYVGTGNGLHVHGWGLYGTEDFDDAHSWTYEAENNYDQGDGLPRVYSQIFFTNRAPGDESHLLRWEYPISQENKDRILKQMAKEGIKGRPPFAAKKAGDVYEYFERKFKSAKAASEFFVRADIDGVKVNMAWMRPGDNEEENHKYEYVSFRDDNITVDMKWVDRKLVYNNSSLMRAIKANAAQMRRHSISHIYTGSAADYDKPSLIHVGTGEGSQVYGWGLYGSDQRSEAENYGNGKLYEQTFFTNRAPGDESHLLKWYEPVSEENAKRIVDYANKIGKPFVTFDPELIRKYNEALKTDQLYASTILNKAREDHELTARDIAHTIKWTGEDVYRYLWTKLGSQKAASEFLARADIDGIKYPVDSYGGKTVKDGDKAGWNYVSFRDDNIRVDHKWVDGEQRYSVTVRRALQDLAAEVNPIMTESETPAEREQMRNSIFVGTRWAEQTRKSYMNYLCARALFRNKFSSNYTPEARDTIYADTGWWRGPDEKWRFDIGDVKPKALGKSNGKNLINGITHEHQRILTFKGEPFISADHAEDEDPESLALMELDIYTESGLSIDEAIRDIAATEDNETIAEYLRKHKRQLKFEDGDEIGMGCKITDMISAPKLFKTYPELANIEVKLFDPDKKDYTGVYTGPTIEFNWDCVEWHDDEPSNVLTMKGVQVITHELQHAVQSLEGFAEGGNVEAHGPKNYWRLAGEVEARNADMRFGLAYMNGPVGKAIKRNSEAARNYLVRKEWAPWDTQDTPDDKQIFFDEKGGMVNAKGHPVKRRSVSRGRQSAMNAEDLVVGFLAAERLAGKSVGVKEADKMLKNLGIRTAKAPDVLARANALAETNRDKLRAQVEANAPEVVTTLANAHLADRATAAFNEAIATGAKAADPALGIAIQRTASRFATRELHAAKGFTAAQMQAELPIFQLVFYLSSLGRSPTPVIIACFIARVIATYRRLRSRSISMCLEPSSNSS